MTVTTCDKIFVCTKDNPWTNALWTSNGLKAIHPDAKDDGETTGGLGENGDYWKCPHCGLRLWVEP